jgi:hypothetical protein
MAFRLGSFARGFAERAMEYKTEEENEIRDLVKASYMDTLEQTRENRKAVKAKREKLTNIGNELKLMGLTDAQAAGIIGSGTEGAERQLELLRESAKSWGKEFDINNVVSAAEDSGITLEEAVNRTIGELKQSQEPVGLGGDRRRSIFGAGKGFETDQFAKYSRQFGEDYATIRSEAKDERVRGELPTVTINQSKLYRPDPLEDIRRRQAEADVKIREGEVARLPDADKLSKVQIQKVEAEIAVLRSQADDDELDLGDVRATLSLVDKQLAPVLIAASGSKIKWTENTGYVTSEKATEQELAVLNNAKEINAEVINLVRQGMDLDKAITHATKYIIPKYYPSPPPSPGREKPDPTSSQFSVPKKLDTISKESIALVNDFLSKDKNKIENIKDRGLFFSTLLTHLLNNKMDSKLARVIAKEYAEDRFPK